MSEIKLLPCPFCGGEAELLHEEDYSSHQLWRVECEECDCCTSEYYDNPGKEHAIRAWNKRKPILQQEKYVNWKAAVMRKFLGGRV